jgi:hypothetical protein
MVKLPDGDKMWISPCGRTKRVAPLRRLSPAFVEAMATEAPDTATADSWNTPDQPDEVMPF